MAAMTAVVTRGSISRRSTRITKMCTVKSRTSRTTHPITTMISRSRMMAAMIMILMMSSATTPSRRFKRPGEAAPLFNSCSSLFDVSRIHPSGFFLLCVNRVPGRVRRFHGRGRAERFKVAQSVVHQRPLGYVNPNAGHTCRRAHRVQDPQSSQGQHPSFVRRL